jgi:type I restriction enzyme S subunit
LNRYASGAAQPGLAVNKLETIRIDVPKLQLQKQYSQFAKQSDKSKFELQKALDELTAMQKKLMLNIFSEQ